MSFSYFPPNLLVDRYSSGRGSLQSRKLTLQKYVYGAVLKRNQKITLTGLSYWSDWRKAGTTGRTRSPYLHQKGTASNALIDGSKNPCHLPGDREREAVLLTPILTHKAPSINSQPALKSHVLLAISFIKIRACPTHPSFSGAVAAAHFVLVRFNSAASAKRRGQHMPPCLWLPPRYPHIPSTVRTSKGGTAV